MAEIIKKPWSGRFKKQTAKSVESFTESISFDKRLWSHDIRGSIAHVRMLVRQGIISSSDAKKIIKGLDEIALEIKSDSFKFRDELEDIHMNIEAAMIERIGEIGGKVHTARSRNDQISLDLRLFLREEINLIIKLIRRFQEVLLKIAERHINTIIPGYTHLQRAQPVTLAHHTIAYIEMFQRDRERLEDTMKRVDTLPLGVCALAGTSLKTDREYLSRLLGFKRISENSMDSVSDRDFIIEFISACSILMMHLSRMAEEIILWATEEFSFIEIDDSFTTGSSIMPQKKNPDVAELIRGKTGRVYGALMSMLTIMKALPLSYNRDMQEDKISLFDTVDTVKDSLSVLADMTQKIRFNKKRMYDAVCSGYSTATDLVEYIVKKGIPFRRAHVITGKIVMYCIEKDKQLNDLSLKEFSRFSDVIEEDVYYYITVEASVKNKVSRGGTSPSLVKKQINRLKRKI